MNLTPEIKAAIDQSVLCVLATASEEGEPNVSPKEIFSYFGSEKIILANIASPQTVRNIKTNPRVCVSFIDILVQKGFKIKGNAKICRKGTKDFEEMRDLLEELTKGLFPFASITAIEMTGWSPILAPRYLLYPETKEETQVRSARKSYGL